MIYLIAVVIAISIIMSARFGASNRALVPLHHDTPTTRVRPPVWYSVLAGVLISFGFLAILSIGFPFLLTGLLLALLGPYRHRPSVFWPPLVSVLTLVAVYVLIVPLSCGATAAGNAGSATMSASRTVCTNLIGIDYTGTGHYNPSLLPALLAGLGTATVAGTVSWLLLSTRVTVHRSS